MKLPNIISIEQQEERLTPEKALWLAVVERAMRDYCFYFEWLQQHRMSCDVAHQERLYGQNRNGYVLKGIAEYNRLCWFLFCDEPAPFNLTYIFDMLDQEDALLHTIRKLCKEQFKLHLNRIKDANMFPRIVEHIFLTTDFNSIKEDSITMEFRQPSVKVRMRIT